MYASHGSTPLAIAAYFGFVSVGPLGSSCQLPSALSGAWTERKRIGKLVVARRAADVSARCICSVADAQEARLLPRDSVRELHADVLPRRRPTTELALHTPKELMADAAALRVQAANSAYRNFMCTTTARNLAGNGALGADHIKVWRSGWMYSESFVTSSRHFASNMRSACF